MSLAVARARRLVLLRRVRLLHASRALAAALMAEQSLAATAARIERLREPPADGLVTAAALGAALAQQVALSQAAAGVRARQASASADAERRRHALAAARDGLERAGEQLSAARQSEAATRGRRLVPAPKPRR